MQKEHRILMIGSRDKNSKKFYCNGQRRYERVTAEGCKAKRTFVFFFLKNVVEIRACLYVNGNHLIERDNFDDAGAKRENCWSDFLN